MCKIIIKTAPHIACVKYAGRFSTKLFALCVVLPYKKGVIKMTYIEMVNSCKTYHIGGSTIYANRDVSFSIEKGELAIILGSSGAGKSTVLNILGGMDTNDSGKVIIDGKDISKYTRNQLTAYRRTDVGFVFQFYNLVQNLTAKENVELASEIVDNALDPVTVLKDVGLADRMILYNKT